MSKIYITREQRQQVSNLKSHDFYKRDQLRANMDEDTYKAYFGFLQPRDDYLDLPTEFQVAHATPAFPEAALSGPILDSAVMRKDLYDSFRYWNPLRVMPRDVQYFQNIAFRVDPINGSEKLLAEGVVVAAELNLENYKSVDPEAFVKLMIFVNEEALLDTTGQPCNLVRTDSFREATTAVYLKAGDILKAPSGTIVLDIIRYELLDYGYVY